MIITERCKAVSIHYLFYRDYGGTHEGHMNCDGCRRTTWPSYLAFALYCWIPILLRDASSPSMWLSATHARLQKWSHSAGRGSGGTLFHWYQDRVVL